MSAPDGWEKNLPKWMDLKSEPLPGFPAVLASVPLDKIQKWPRNPRKNDEAAKRLLKSMEVHGYRVPMILDQNAELRAGHTRLRSLQEQGKTHIPVLVQWFDSQAEAEGFSIADNKLSSIAEFDFSGLADILQDIDTGEFDMEAMTGFNMKELEDIANWTPSDKPDTSHPPNEREPSEHNVREGDVWICGDHRVVCGSALSATDVAKATDGQQVRLCVTDPPYDMSAAEQARAILAGGTQVAVVLGSGKTWFELIGMREFRFHFDIVLRFGGSVRINSLSSFARTHYRCALIESDIGNACVLSTHGRLRFHPKRAYKMLGGSSIIEVDTLDRSNHKHGKPIKLWRGLYAGFDDEVIYEPFLGSGAMLCAAEIDGRRVRGLELDPNICASAIDRWARLTGKVPKDLITGKELIFSS